MTNFFPIFVLAQIILSIAFFVVLVRLLMRLVRWLLGLVNLHGAAIGKTPITRVLSFAAAISIFPNILYYSLHVLYGLLSTIFVAIPAEFGRIYKGAYDLCVTPNADNWNCFNIITDLTLRFWSDIAQRIIFVFELRSFPLERLIYMVAIWAALAILIDAISTIYEKDNLLRRYLIYLYKFFYELFSYLGTKIRSIKSQTRQKTILVLILLFAGYLGLTSLAAIHSFRGTGETSELTRQKLEQDLQLIVMTEAQFDIHFPENFDYPVPFANNEFVEDNVIHTRLKNDLDEATNRLKKFVSDWKNLRSHYLLEKENLRKRAAQHFEIVNKNRWGAREERQHFLSLTNWLESSLSNARQHLRGCQTSIVNYAGQVRRQSAYVLDLVRQTAKIPVERFEEAGNWLGNSVSDAARAASSDCRPWSRQSVIPTRETYGSYLGVFGFATGWLLRTESLPLALLTGMFGFGLVGASTSAFIRKPTDERPSNEPSENLSIVVRGITAAVVVFLGVYGGLAAFAGDKTDPDPHMVLFTCFVGAVFSDAVWRWAQNRLRSNLGEDQVNVTEAKTSGGSKNTGGRTRRKLQEKKQTT